MTTTAKTISIEVELPEQLHNALQAHLETSSYSRDRFFQLAIAFMIIQTQGPKSDRDLQRAANRIYLDAMFGEMTNVG